MFNQNFKIIHWTKKRTTYLGVAILGITALLLPGCDIPQETEDPQVTTPTTPDVDVTEGDPQVMEGEEITIRRLVEDTLGEYGFITEANPGEPVIVINTTGEAFALPDPSIPIQATGEVRELSLPEIESQYGLALESDLYAEYEGQPVIIAESLAFAPTPEELSEAPIDYFMERQIAVEGDLRMIEEAPNAFALFEEGWIDDRGVLVIAVEENLKEGGKARGIPLEEGENIVVTGTARPFSRELIEEAGFDWNEQQISDFEEQYTGRPIIVADGVYPSATDPAPGS